MLIKELYKHVIFVSNYTLLRKMGEFALSPALLSQSLWSGLLVLRLGFSYVCKGLSFFPSCTQC